MRSANAEQLPKVPAEKAGEPRYLCTGQSYLERLGVLYVDEVRLSILAQLSMREMGPREFFETVGGTSYDSIRRHFLKLVETGWLRKVRTVASGRGRPEALYRATEQAVIDTDTWRTIPISIRDGFTAMLLEDMGARQAEALAPGTAAEGLDQVASFEILEVDEEAWRKAADGFEHCFQTLGQEQIDAKIRLEASPEQPLLMVVNLGSFEAPGPRAAGLALPKPEKASPSASWPRCIGKVFSDPLDLAIVDKLNGAAMTPAQLQEELGGATTQAFLRRCKRLAKLGLIVNVETQTGGALHGASVYHFRAAAPNISAAAILGRVPAPARKDPSWETFREFVTTSVAAVDAGAFNSRYDRHLTKSTLLVDRLGWLQATKALRDLEATLRRLEEDLAGASREKATARFRAAFLLSSFQAPSP